jgi:hypothetical protein
MHLELDYVAFVAAFIAACAILDYRTRKIPNWLTASAAVLGLAHSALAPHGIGPLWSLAGFAVGIRDLASRLRAGIGATWVLEGESRKVGDVILPQSLWSAMTEGVAVELTAPHDRRVEVLRADYLASEEDRRELLLQLPHVEERMERVEGAPPLTVLLESGRIEELVRLLLARYYDPRYRHGERGRRYAATFDASDPADAAERVIAWIEASRSS